MDRVTVVYIAGFSRSGSTLLDRLLGRIDGFFSLGEMLRVWRRGFKRNELCGCGEPFKSCPFWTVVVQKAFGGLESVDSQVVIELQRSVDRIRCLPQLTSRALRSSEFQSRLREYRCLLGSLYLAAAQVSGAEILVDSSKQVPHGLVLDGIPSVDLRIIHLVRDARAVAYSWQRVKRAPEIHWKEAYMHKMSFLQSAQLWSFQNLLVELLRNLGPAHYAFTRYEDLSTRPQEEISRLLRQLNLGSRDLTHLGNRAKVSLGINHMVMGNPIRFEHGSVAIELDDEWQQRLPGYQSGIILAMTLPLMLKYGYL